MVVPATETTAREGPVPSDSSPVDGVAPSRPLPLPRQVDWRAPLGLVAFLLSVIAFLVGWFQIANTEQEWEQIPYLASSGGLGLLALGVGVTLFVSLEHTRDREAVGRLLQDVNELRSDIAELRSQITKDIAQ